MTNSNFDISASVNKLYYRIILNELRLMNNSANFPNISYNTLLYLDIISLTENCTVSQLAEVLHIAKSSVTLKINELMRQGLVEKTQSKTDKRVKYLTVSSQIYKEYQYFDLATQRAIQAMAQEFSKNELALLDKMLNQFSSYYEVGLSDEE
ncbi:MULTISPECIES: MarR family transcriptional regulator [unclassified Enterococcus]|uniref:MarR family winged helix-turn-helix transcriptional regulator n=1 Tax=unclassified Enterococcus TaxID=2608891 RepID=UPI00155637DB|nr:MULTISPECIES: MarR family transcriptional regulator [unclassified Enterococcus]MBS7578344.1 MarR family transcriptional regulator [Enterococcus sp. MMGLQ5-2]MBS7585581.1 MarR family transcriptional regulator [Enterococcus sp. MMGLQ5-1]NPD13440.1 MarR family transcriptional regulator [Enterococcus sp. MMGLQ5-1]NPD38175.1 MarR family transcriptional regulator [Enterococcus sp. MMGLQ5-2]